MRILRTFRKLSFRDVAFAFRMGSGFAGDVNRTHPMSILPRKIDTTTPPNAYGQAVLMDATSHGVRRFTVGDDGVTKLYGVTVRPYPIQQAQTAQNFGSVDFGSVAPPTSGVIDVLEHGHIVGKVNGSPVAGGAVYVWVAASSGAHVQGGFEAAADAGNTAAIANAYFENSPDADGNVEIVVFRQ